MSSGEPLKILASSELQPPLFLRRESLQLPVSWLTCCALFGGIRARIERSRCARSSLTFWTASKQRVREVKSKPMCCRRLRRQGIDLATEDPTSVWVRRDQNISSEGFDPGSERTLAAWMRHASRA